MMLNTRNKIAEGFNPSAIMHYASAIVHEMHDAQNTKHNCRRLFLHQSFIVHRQLCMKCMMLNTRDSIAEGIPSPIIHYASAIVHEMHDALYTKQDCRRFFINTPGIFLEKSG
jgi:hypothetical protein